MNKLTVRKLPGGNYVKIGDDMTWPIAGNGYIEWMLRYGSESDIIENRMLLASIINAYRELIGLTQKERNEICSALKEATP